MVRRFIHSDRFISFVTEQIKKEKTERYVTAVKLKLCCCKIQELDSG